MDWFTLLGIAIALAMDAFAVALGAGVTLEHLTPRHVFRLGFHFGLFQAMMPILGWLAGLSIQQWISSFDHWIAFGLLAFVGGRMIYESFSSEGADRPPTDPTRGFTLVMLSIATSLDALAVGLSLAILEIGIWFPAAIIGIVAGIFTVTGMLLGRRASRAWGRRVEVLGGLILWAIGVRILLEHTVLS